MSSPASHEATFIVPSRTSRAIPIRLPSNTSTSTGVPAAEKEKVLNASPAQPFSDLEPTAKTGKLKITTDNATENVQAQPTRSQSDPSIPHTDAVALPRPPRSVTAQQPPRPESQLDIHTQTYIPLWLRAANDSPAIIRPCRPLDSLKYKAFIKSFTSPRYLRPIPYLKPPHIKKVSFVHATSASGVSINHYFEYFYECLQNEISAEAQDLHRLRMYNVPFERSGIANHCYSFTIPGLRENSPRLDLGDIVLFRQLITSSMAQAAAIAWYAPGGGRDRGVVAPTFRGEEYHAVVWGLSRAKEQLVLRIDYVNCSPASRTANLTFIVQEHRCTPVWRGIATVADEILVRPMELSKPSWLGTMLFPSRNDAVIQDQLSKGIFSLDWYDQELNYEQHKAVDAIVTNKYGEVPYLISGPPGTGKTKTLVEAALQLLGNAPEDVTPHLLICAPSDPAADTITLRLSKYLSQKELFRLNSWTRPSAEVPDSILGFTFTESDLFSFPEFETLMQYKIIVTTCKAADMLVQARLTNRDLAKLALETVFVISPSTIVDIKPVIHWTALLIDEAAQATEPDTLIPLLVVSPILPPLLSNDHRRFAPQLIMAGDEHQLGPHLFNKSSPLSISLFGRLFARPFYADHPLSRIHGSRPLTRKLLPLPRPAFTNLIRNYRSHSAILATPSLLFYSDTLLSESTHRTPLVTEFPHWKPPYRWPIIFVQSTSPDAFEDMVTSAQGITGTSLVNSGETERALNVTKTLLKLEDHVQGGKYTATKPVLEPNEIAVIAPFRAQVYRLRELFRKHGFGTVNIGPLEAFQGLESRVIIFCTTRTRLAGANEQARFIKEDIAWNRGVIGQKQKFNVAMTRAKEALFVIGDERALTCTGDECWTQFLGFVGRNGAVQFESPEGEQSFKEQMQDWPNRVGRLEAALRFRVDTDDYKARRDHSLRDEIEETPSRTINPSAPAQSATQNERLPRSLMMSDDDRMLSDGHQAQHSLQQFAALVDAGNPTPGDQARSLYSQISPFGPLNEPATPPRPRIGTPSGLVRPTNTFGPIDSKVPRPENPISNPTNQPQQWKSSEYEKILYQQAINATTTAAGDSISNDNNTTETHKPENKPNPSFTPSRNQSSDKKLESSQEEEGGGRAGCATQ
ncbi:putative potentail helicase mov-10 [Phaeomoniella chlamydospora]|uniref:Putative potentail helicase mov-10 n=1 Tax=Phaeomoniella chlamydospora TaxID=158046 RepID=A0A0G2GPK3_PHACM|nr:putative potentail helicase mov-10 [Phaeomoniella chlamydospora]